MSSSSSSSSSSSRSAVPVLPAFTSGDFGLWQMKSLGIFLAHGLLGVVESDIAVALIKEERTVASKVKKEAAAAIASGSVIKATTPMELTKEKEELMKQSKRAYGALVSALGATQLRLCQHVALGDSHGIWSVLLDTYERKSVATRVRLIEQLFTIQLTRGENVNLLVARLTDLQRKLADQEEVISETILLFILLRSVSRQYPTLVTLLKMKDTLKFDDAVEALKNEEERTKMDTRGGDQETMHYMHSGTKKEERRCHNCNKVGHLNFQCPEKKCHRCNRNGHVASNCRASFPAKKTQADDEEEEAQMMREEFDEAYGSDWS